ncbi:podoplanin isoform X2 [Ambystoma mexicanum]|uniref:podoplanin isoform X2 n=1 Tax=Ambystoma mexicanum TaxID=8296 RepID=UPI0037E7C5FB
MWTLRVLAAVLLAGVFCASAGAATVSLEDETPTADPKPKSFTELKEDISQLPLTEESVTEELTTKSDALTSPEAENTTNGSVVIEDPDGSLNSAVLFGIIVGILVAVGIISTIIIIVVKKMSGRP